MGRQEEWRVLLQFWRNLLLPSSEWKSTVTILEEAAAPNFRVKGRNGGQKKWKSVVTISEEAAVTIFKAEKIYPEDWGSRFL
jgi:hypothetical protein